MTEKDQKIKAEIAKIEQTTETLSKKRKELEGELSINVEKRRKMDDLDKKHDRLLKEYYDMKNEVDIREKELTEIKDILVSHYDKKCKYLGHYLVNNGGYGTYCRRCDYEE